MPESLAALQPAAPRRVQDGRPTPAQQQVPSSRPDPRPSRWGSTEDGFELAGWWRRVAATIIDFVIIAVVVMASLNHEVTDAAHEYARFMQWANDQVAAGKTPTLNPQQIASQFHFIDPMTTLITAYVIAQAVYQFIMLSACAASVGQLVMRMRAAARRPEPLTQYRRFRGPATCWEEPAPHPRRKRHGPVRSRAR